MKLRYSPASPYVRKVSVVALETGLDKRIERIPTSVSPTKPNTDIGGDNPLFKVPALALDDSGALFDSPVICEYLDSLHGGPKMFPANGAARWTALRRQATGDGILDAAILMRYELLRPEANRWADWRDGQMAKVQGGLAALESEADKLGATIDIGTITIGCALGYLDFRFADLDWRKPYPKLATWYGGFSARPSMKATVPQG